MLFCTAIVVDVVVVGAAVDVVVDAAVVVVGAAVDVVVVRAAVVVVVGVVAADVDGCKVVNLLVD